MASLILRSMSFGLAAMAVAGSLFAATKATEAVTPAEARAIAKEAYIYGFPMVDGYRIQYAFTVDTKGPEFKAPWNQLNNTARVFTPEDKTVQTPNSDTPYSMLSLDLRTQPIVLTVPPMEKTRYFSCNWWISIRPTSPTSARARPAMRVEAT